ncbi:MAG: hypothetical protein Q7T49_03005 [bacterium]|nr:hypothetical protein [bacterium]
MLQLEGWVLAVYLVMAMTFTIPLLLVLVWSMRRPDPTSQLAKAVAAGRGNESEPENPALADALRMGQVGETVGGVEPADDEVIEARDRRILNWNGYGRVSGIDAHGHFFTGRIVTKCPHWRGWEVLNGGWVLVQKDRSHRAVWCSYENRVTPALATA